MQHYVVSQFALIMYAKCNDYMYIQANTHIQLVLQYRTVYDHDATIPPFINPVMYVVFIHVPVYY